MAFARVARADEIPPGQTRFYLAGHRPLVLANRGGRIHALHGLCPHRGFPLDGASLWGDLITCPWHHFQFDLETGENRYPHNVYPGDMPGLERQTGPLRTYRVEIREGEIWVDLE